MRSTPLRPLSAPGLIRPSRKTLPQNLGHDFVSDLPMRALSALVFSTAVLVIPSLKAQSATGGDTATAPASASPVTPAGATSSTSTPTSTPSSPSTPAVSHRSSVPGLGSFTFEPSAAEKKHAEALAKAEQEAEEEKPRNGIVRLPNYEVKEDRPPVFTKQQLDTAKGLRADAVKKYISSAQEALNFARLPSWLGGMSNEDIAMDMYHDQLRLDTRRDLLHEASQLQAAGDSDSANELRQQSQDLYLRPQAPPAPPTAGVSH